MSTILDIYVYTSTDFSLNNWTIYYCTYIWINNSLVEKKSTWINAEKGRFRTHIPTTLFHFLRIEILFLFGIWLFISLFHPSDYFQKIHVVLTLAVIMENVSWTDTGDTNVNVSVVTPEVDVKVSCIYRKSKISFHTWKLKLKFMNFKHIQCTYTMSWYVAKINTIRCLSEHNNKSC